MTALRRCDLDLVTGTVCARSVHSERSTGEILLRRSPIGIPWTLMHGGDRQSKFDPGRGGRERLLRRTSRAVPRPAWLQVAQSTPGRFETFPGW